MTLFFQGSLDIIFLVHLVLSIHALLFILFLDLVIKLCNIK